MNWEHVTSEEEILDIAENISSKSTCVIFKHSTTCSISSVAQRRLQDFKPSENVRVFYLDLLRHRGVSNFIADKFEVRHESPQILVIKNGKAVYHNSHLSIDIQELEGQIND